MPPKPEKISQFRCRPAEQTWHRIRINPQWMSWRAQNWDGAPLEPSEPTNVRGSAPTWVLPLLSAVAGALSLFPLEVARHFGAVLVSGPNFSPQHTLVQLAAAGMLFLAGRLAWFRIKARWGVSSFFFRSGRSVGMLALATTLLPWLPLVLVIAAVAAEIRRDGRSYLCLVLVPIFVVAAAMSVAWQTWEQRMAVESALLLPVYGRLLLEPGRSILLWLKLLRSLRQRKNHTALAQRVTEAS